MFPPEIQRLISTYLIFGVFPLDKVLHVTVGMVVTIGLRLLGFRLKTVFWVLALIAVAKEIHDSFVLNNSLPEHVLDIFVTFCYPTLLAVVVALKAKLNRSPGRGPR